MTIAIGMTVAIRVAIAVGMTIDWALLRRRDGRILAERQPHLDFTACLRRQCRPHQAHVAIVDPIAKKAIGRCDGYGRSLMSDKIKRPDPSLITNLPELIPHAVARTLPQSIHIVSP
jgi:hypothetical protein